jgi:hypothetical protein
VRGFYYLKGGYMEIMCKIGIHKEGKIIDREYIGKTLSQGTGKWHSKYKLTLQCRVCGKECTKGVMQ